MPFPFLLLPDKATLFGLHQSSGSVSETPFVVVRRSLCSGGGMLLFYLYLTSPALRYGHGRTRHTIPQIFYRLVGLDCPAALIKTRLLVTARSVLKDRAGVCTQVQVWGWMILLLSLVSTHDAHTHAHTQLHWRGPAPAPSAQFKNPVCSVACV